MFDEAYFDAGLDRMGTASVKWDGCRRQHGAEALPMWVADMDFASPPAIREALEKRAAHPTWGYTEIEPEDEAAALGFWRRRHGLEAEAEWIVWLPCVVTGLKAAILACTEPGEPVVLMSPVYGPFRDSVEVTGRRVADAPLIRDEDGQYRMDLDAVEARLREGARLILLCSPHNPVSRPWTEEELRALLAVANRYQACIASDEIHADFVYAPDVFVPLLSLQTERTISLTAPSKTFNVAGLQTAVALVPDAELRGRLRHVLDAGGVTSGNIFGLTAARAAWLHGDEWLDGLLRYLDGNRRLLAELVEKELPGAVLTPVRATYLGWLDLRSWGYTCEELARRTEAAGVIFTGGTFFGDVGEGHLRINFGCPRANIPEAVRRLKKALGAAPERKAAIDRDTLEDRILGSLIGCAAGDALGYEVEFVRWRAIQKKFGEQGIQEYVLHGGKALVSDDTQMTLFTAAGLVLAAAHGRPADWGIWRAYQDWLHTQTGGHPDEEAEDWLLRSDTLFVRQAPGNTCLSALQSRVMGTIEAPVNDSKGCGAVMRTGPCGFAPASLAPEGCAAEDTAMVLGARAGAMTHGHTLGWLPAGMLADMVRSLALEGMDMAHAAERAMRSALRLFGESRESVYQMALIAEALTLAREAGEDEAHIRALGEGWVGEEALAIAVYCAAKYEDDFDACIRAAVNHSGDSDSTGAIAGTLWGAEHGASAIDRRWGRPVDVVLPLVETAQRLTELCAGDKA